jgi:GH18 family chitinase
VCAKLPNPSNTALTGVNAPLHRTTDPSKRYGTYAYGAVDENGDNGIWIGYEDADTAGNKAKYVREKKLGGVGVFDLSLDDVRGSCSGEKFQILRAIKYQLDKA